VPRLVSIDTVSPVSFSTLGIPLLMGRDFEARDSADSPEVLIVNQTFAETYWPGENPLEKRIAFTTRRQSGGYGPGEYLQVVGVVKTVKYDEISEAPQPAVYRAVSQSWLPSLTLLLRTAGDPMAVLPAVREVMRDIDPNLAPSDTRALTGVIGFKLLPAKFAAALFMLFGALALVLAMVGLYGVMSYMVSQRTHEIGVRMAVGAEEGDVVRLILRQGLTLTLLGLAIRLVAAFGFTGA